MSQKVQILRLLVEQRLIAAAEEIFGLFERTIAEYEEELCRTKEENQRQHQMLDPRDQSHKTDVQQLSVVKEEVPPEQQEWNPIEDQEEPEPEPPHIKEEQEELWTSQEENITKFPSTPVPVKSEDDDEEKVKFSQLNQTHNEENKVNFGGSEPSSSFHPLRHLQRKNDEQNEDSEETEDSEDQTLNHKPESKLPTNSSTEQMETQTDGDNDEEPDINLNVKERNVDSKSLLEEHADTHTGEKLDGSPEPECEATFSQKKKTTQETKSPRDNLTNTDLTQSDVGCEKKLHHCSVCSKTFCRNSNLQRHMRIHTGEKPFSCSLCGSKFTQKSTLQTHMTSHTGEKPIKCSQCNKCFRDKTDIKRHISVHTGEKPFKCSLCHKCFSSRHEVKGHMRIHTGEGFDCSVCEKRFTKKSNLTSHMRIHTGEGFDCSVCGKKFTKKSNLTSHMTIHTGEKPFFCSLCEKRFREKSSLHIHMMSHTGEKPFKCSQCQKCFVNRSRVKRHMIVHTGERPFSCEVCQKCFSRKDDLQIHMNTHGRIDRMSLSLESDSQRLKNMKNNDAGKF